MSCGKKIYGINPDDGTFRFDYSPVPGDYLVAGLCNRIRFFIYRLRALKRSSCAFHPRRCRSPSRSHRATTGRLPRRRSPSVAVWCPPRRSRNTRRGAVSAICAEGSPTSSGASWLMAWPTVLRTVAPRPAARPVSGTPRSCLQFAGLIDRRSVGPGWPRQFPSSVTVRIMFKRLALVTATIVFALRARQRAERAMLVIHGGAGTITRASMTAEAEKQYREALGTGAAHRPRGAGQGRLEPRRGRGGDPRHGRLAALQRRQGRRVHARRAATSSTPSIMDGKTKKAGVGGRRDDHHATRSPPRAR